MSAPLDYLGRWPLRLWLLLTGVFLYAPLVVLVAFSFNDSRRNVVWRGFTLDYYGKALGNDGLIGALANSLTVAVIAAAVSTVLGALAAVALWRFRFPGKAAAEGALVLPVAAPEICIGVATLIFFSKVLPWPEGLAWPLKLGPIVIAHIAFCFPLVAIVARARLASFDRAQEEAARDLGAGEWRAFIDVLVPHMRPALIAGTLLAFTTSLDDFVITFFASGPDTVTFPVKVYSMLRFSVTPEVNAASALMMAITVAATFVLVLMQGRQVVRNLPL